MIYLVEDDSNIRELVIYTLKNSGFEAEGFAYPSEFWKTAGQNLPDMIILDIMLPEEDGISMLKKIRNSARYEDIPVMMLTAKGSEYDKVTGLNNGADDYMPKPFGLMELTARVKALLRRSRSSEKEADIVSLGTIVISNTDHMVTASDHEIELTYKEFQLLKLLIENPGRVFTRDQLLTEIWGYTYAGESRTVDVHVRKLRKKLGQDEDIIETIRGVGYRARKNK